MAKHDRTHEARIRLLEEAIRLSNPGTVTSSEAVSLKEHFESRIESVEKATMLAANTLERRLEGMNEFRDTLRDQASRFVTRDEMNVQLERDREAISDLQTFKDRLEGKASASAVYVAYAMSLIGIIIGVVGLLN